MSELNRGVHAFTSFTYSYLPKAMVLSETLKHFNPTWHLTAVISDRCPKELEGFDLSRYFDHVITIEELDLPASWIFKHDIVELCTAVKGPMMHKLLSEGAEKVIYLDPDIAVFSDLSHLEELLGTHSIILTPHQLAPDATTHAIKDNEICSLMHGVYNLGFIGVSNDANGRDFGQWWRDRLLQFCYNDIPSGLFTDQRWCDLIPCFFDQVGIVKDPGCNVSSWNLSTRTISASSQGAILANSSPLKFYHFSKLGNLGFTMTIRYAGNNSQVYSLWYWYNDAVKRAQESLELDESFDLGSFWYFKNYTSGREIQTIERVTYRTRTDLQNAFKNPFDSEFEAWCLSHL